MKFECSSPLFSAEVLDKTDVLLSSVEVAPESAKTEKENAYRDFTDFVFSGDWFSD